MDLHVRHLFGSDHRHIRRVRTDLRDKLKIFVLVIVSNQLHNAIITVVATWKANCLVTQRTKKLSLTRAANLVRLI